MSREPGASVAGRPAAEPTGLGVGAATSVSVAVAILVSLVVLSLTSGGPGRVIGAGEPPSRPAVELQAQQLR